MEAIVDTVENVITPLGLMTGDYACGKRFIVGGIIGGFIVTWLKPEAMFTKEQTPRPWNVLSESSIATSTPWLIGPVIGGIIMGMFI